MKYSAETLQYLFEKGHANVKFLLEMARIPRRTIYDNLKKFKLHGNLTSKEGSGRKKTFNTNNCRSEISKHSNGQ